MNQEKHGLSPQLSSKPEILTLEITCPSCDHLIAIGTLPPKFCDQCGSALPTYEDPAESESAEDATLVPTKPRLQPPEPSPPKRKIDRYLLVDQLGSGGMGVVYRAIEEDTQREVALKLLSMNMTSDRENVDRFIREARLAAQISHPRTTFVYEAGQYKDRPYIVMELMPGETLQDVLDRDKTIPVSRAVDYIIDVIDGLSAAHKLNVIHRDVKPSNCFVDVDGRIKVGDFGLSKSLVTDVELTRTGTFMGTPSYAAPEQIRGAEVDQRTDVYAVGATLYCLIANRPPFVGDAMSVTAQIISDPPDKLKSIVPSVPRDLERIIDRTLRKDPDERYRSLGELRDALLPFASRGTTLTQIGRRSAAYMIDYVLVSFATQFLMFTFLMLTGSIGDFATDPEGSAERLKWIQVNAAIVTWTIMFLYFAITEGLLGWTVGKRILGLRVINQDGETPGLIRGAVRSFVIPSAFAIPVIAALIRWQFSGEIDNPLEGYSLMSAWLLARIAEILPVMICLLTMRQSNGLRGIHGILSGTRVIRLALAGRYELKQLPRLKVVKWTGEHEKKIGPFTIDGVISGNSRCCVYSGHDSALDRNVLIYQWNRRGIERSVIRHINRPSRVRWIQGGSNEQGRWDAFEMIDGISFPKMAELPKLFTWENTRNAIHDVVVELEISLKEESVPRELTLDQFIVDRDGHGKLLEIPLPRDNVGDETVKMDRDQPAVADDCFVLDEQAAQKSLSPNLAVCRLVSQIFELVVERQVVPSSVQRLMESFKNQAKSPETISRFADRLDEVNQKLPRLTWDSRLGVLAVTLGGEMVVLTGIILAVTWGWVSLFGYLPLWKPMALVTLFLVVFFGIGFAMRGSPVFRFMKIDVQRKSGGPASRLQCGARNALSWLPFVVMMVGFSYITFVGFEQIAYQRQLAASKNAERQRQQEFLKSEDASTRDKPRESEPADGSSKDDSNSSDPGQSPMTVKQNSGGGRKQTGSNDSVSQPNSAVEDVESEADQKPPVVPEVQESPLSFLLILLVTPLFLVLCLVFTVLSVVWPDRGVQDRLAGTRLVPE